MGFYFKDADGLIEYAKDMVIYEEPIEFNTHGLVDEIDRETFYTVYAVGDDWDRALFTSRVKRECEDFIKFLKGKVITEHVVNYGEAYNEWYKMREIPF